MWKKSPDEAFEAVEGVYGLECKLELFCVVLFDLNDVEIDFLISSAWKKETKVCPTLEPPERAFTKKSDRAPRIALCA